MTTLIDIFYFIFLCINEFNRFVKLDKNRIRIFLFPALRTMEDYQTRNIEEATEQVKKRLPLEKIRSIPKYKDLSSEDYEKLMKNTETIALLILKTFILKYEEV